VPPAVVGAVWVWRRRSASDAFPFLVAGLVALVVYYFATGRYAGSDLGIQYHVFSLPYAAASVGTGLAAAVSWLEPRVSSRLVPVVAGVAVVALFAQSLNVFAQSVTDEFGGLGTCAEALDVSMPGDLVVVGTTSPARDGLVVNNHDEPVIFFLAERKGWSLAADEYEPATLAAYRDQGARFFVNPEPDLLPPGGALSTWLATEATQVQTVVANGCDVWKLAPAARS
jgi:hypothetical protein